MKVRQRDVIAKKEYDRVYYLKNKEKVLKRHNLWKKKNSDKVKAGYKNYYQEHKEEKKEYARRNRDRIREYNKKYKEDRREYFKKYNKAYRIKNKKKLQQHDKDYYKKNRKKILEYKHRSYPILEKKKQCKSCGTQIFKRSTYCKKCRNVEERAPWWKGDNVKPAAGNRRARMKYKANICEVCGLSKDDSIVERHHIDGNTLNNQPSNIIILCSKHHGRANVIVHQIKKGTLTIPKKEELINFLKTNTKWT